ncbi:hypothetical protein FNH05_04945 [Amycolatopsis rhizosphaerae]|uniref:Uncharacterized protein n=1 Tax=Amycolatopsis rhizosphaerae TaxID=2053003 RepID=A0A558DGH1_9PSEU|nr:hypothetical protein [Amycolatopsis rhizosphaerae]TVT60124.1 hypothetical protein FNH05_04945 [Amycolatopsis rhizosphaerae]
MNIALTPAQLLVGMGCLLLPLVLWRGRVRRNRRRAEAAIGGARLLSLFGRVVFTAALIVGVQWIVVTKAADNHGLMLGVLGLPALFAAHALTRALTVTAFVPPRGGRR